MRTWFIVLSMLVLAGFAAAGKKPADPAAAAAASGRGFAFDLYAQLREEESNLFFSPLSVSIALAMTRQGAGGETAAQMDRVFGWGDGDAAADLSHLVESLEPGTVKEGWGEDVKEVPTFELSVANTLWAQEGLLVKGPFQKALRESFGAALRRLDFRKTEQARAAINDWVLEETRQKIRNIVPEGLPTPDTLLALANAIYFKARWEHPFNDRFTKEDAFHLSGGAEVRAPFLFRVGSYGYLETEEAQVLEIDYRGRETSMVIVLPKARGGLAALEAGLDAAAFDGWIGKLERAVVSVKLPKFEVESSAELAEVLSRLGMADAFDHSKADFTRITEVKPLAIGAVLHKAWVKVDESGTEAAAATVVMMTKGAAPSVQAEFKIDHPFLFAIRHRATGALLFMGRIANPAP